LLGGIRDDFFKDIMMVYEVRQVPAPSGSRWLFDLSCTRGPQFVVPRTGAVEARKALAEHLGATESVPSQTDAAELLAEAEVEPVAVVW
jgi:hypothetical protein